MSSGNFRALGSVMMMIGFLVTVVVGDQATSGGIFSSGREFSGKALIIIFLTALYHITSALLCFGVARCLEANTSEETSVDSMDAGTATESTAGKSQPANEPDEPEDPWA
ncbi:MAG: hypothetical protein DRQ65_09065 [Gammaproteobacteria bacterium]|nr:MAG: hypothetical protein DRQ65_09065 [Gammaproteobacteria bacterium]